MNIQLHANFAYCRQILQHPLTEKIVLIAIVVRAGCSKWLGFRHLIGVWIQNMAYCISKQFKS